MNHPSKIQFKSIDEFLIIAPPDITKANLGHGSYGVVKLAKHHKQNNKYALKIVDCKKLHGPNELDIIKREIKIHSQLDHPNIIKFYGTFQENNIITMVLEYAEHGNLYNYLKKHVKLQESEAFIYFYQTLKAIDYLHKRDILHRDIKPENLLLDSNYCIKLCDFGWSTEGIKLKRTTFCGTYEYMSPEVVFKKPYNENIDIWSLGVLLYELLHGRSCFRAKNLNEISMKLRRPFDIHFDESLSEDVKDLIKNILKLESADRFNLKLIFEHKWIKKMYVQVDFENYENRMKNSNSSSSFKQVFKETQRTIPNEKTERLISRKSFKIISEPEEKPFQATAMNEKENIRENKKLYSFQALDNISKPTISTKLRRNPTINEKENKNEINNSTQKSKIFEYKSKKSSPDRVLKSMDNLNSNFEFKLHLNGGDFISSILNKKIYNDIK